MRVYNIVSLLLVSVVLLDWRVSAAQNITFQFEFQTVAQGRVGIIEILGSGLLRADVTVLDRSYPCYPASQGAVCLIAVPMDEAVRDYPLTVSLVNPNGTHTTKSRIFSVTVSQVINETINLPGTLDYLLRDDVQANEEDRLHEAYSLVTPASYWEGQFIAPLVGSPGSSFGTFRLYNGKVPNRHTGQDIHAVSGTRILASANGRVVLSRFMDIHGNNIVIDHGRGIYSEYAHLSVRYVVPGQFVLQGQVIGLSGSTGRSTGPHFHWEIAVNGIEVDPSAFIQLTVPR